MQRLTLPLVLIGSLVLVQLGACKKQTDETRKMVVNPSGKADTSSAPGKGQPDPPQGKTAGGKDVKQVAPPQGTAWKCGNGTCEINAGEDCIVCDSDCGKCDGCQLKKAPLCPGCKCELCVCKKLPDCCSRNGIWTEACVKACKEDCGGCGLK